MRKIAIVLAAVIGLPGLAEAQASVDIHVDLPFVLPRLVVVTPGVQVVPDIDEEVFFVSGFYWVRRDGGWYRSRSHRGGWAFVPRGVPASLVKIPPGKYKRWKAAPAAYREERGHDRHEREHHGREHKDRGHGKHKKH